MKEKTYPSDNLDKFMLRLPKGMREKIKAHAEESGRSMNSEIISRLEASFGRTGNYSAIKATNLQMGGELSIVNSLISSLKDRDPESFTDEDRQRMIFLEKQRDMLMHDLFKQYEQDK